MKVAIIGAGAAGLCLAIRLAGQGHHPIVFEKRSQATLLDEGLFLTLAPNGLRALANLGPLSDLTDRGIETLGIALLDERGHRLGFFDQSGHSATFGAPSLTLARSALIAVLLTWAKAAGVEMRFSTRLADLETTATTITAGFDGQPPMQFDWLAGCDGIGSISRQLSMPLASQPHFTGLNGTGGVADMPDIPATDGIMTMVFGHEAFFGWIKHGVGPVHWFNSFATAQPAPSLTIAALRQMHRRDPAPVRAILDAVTTTPALYPIFDMPPLARWHQGPVVLLGDAAHAIGPHAGQGASLAIADAMTLAAALARCPDPASAFASYQSLNQPLVGKVVRVTARNASNKRQTTAFSRALRRLILPLVLPLGERSNRRLLAEACGVQG